MKKTLFFLSAVSAVLFLSFKSNHINNDNKQYVDTLSFYAQPDIWQEQMEFAKKHCERISKSSVNGIEFIGYTYKGKIETQEQKDDIFNKMFDGDTYVVKYPGETFFEIVTYRELRKEAKSKGQVEPGLLLRKQLESAVTVGMDIVEVEWKYKGKTIKSIAIASNNEGGILYEHIGNMITIPDTGNKYSSEDIRIAIENPQTRTMSETTERSFEIEPHGDFCAYGKCTWECSIKCVSTFYTNDGILAGRSATAEYDSSIGWYCSADVCIISGDIDNSKFSEFSWGYAYSNQEHVTINAGPLGVTIIPGYASGKSATIVHRMK